MIMSPARKTAAILTVGTELTAGLSLDTNTRTIAAKLTTAGFDVRETTSVPDDAALAAFAMTRLVEAHSLVVVTGGLGPTHDDVTLQAAADAFSLTLTPDPALLKALEGVVSLHSHPRAQEQVLHQALVPEGGTVLMPSTGTAPGLVITLSEHQVLVLLPGPPHEMEPMLHSFLAEETTAVSVATIRCTGIGESDAQLRAQDALGDVSGIDFTVLSSPGDVRVILRDTGAGQAALDDAASRVTRDLDEWCYSTDGSSLAQVVVRLARQQGVTLATAESCTGGLVSAGITSVPGASDVFLGGLVTYADEAKTDLLGVPAGTLEEYGAVSAETAAEMALGALGRTGADLAVAVTGIAGPGGATPDKPVGLVWFGMARRSGLSADAVTRHHQLRGDRDTIRTRATIVALDLLRRALLEERTNG